MHLQIKIQEVYMPAERLTMRKIREVFRQKFDCDISNRQIAISCNIARSTVGEYLFRFQQAALSLPLPQDIDDNQSNTPFEICP